MNRFKEMLETDLSSVFFNDQEFGDAVNIDGVPLLAIKDSDRLIDRAEALGNDGDKLIFFRREEWLEKIGKPPSLAQYCLIDGRSMRITDLKEDEGLYEIVFSREA